jgi:hypothetical protein
VTSDAAHGRRGWTDWRGRGGNGTSVALANAWTWDDGARSVTRVDRQAALCRRVLTELERRGVTERVWACGQYDDDRCCLLLEAGVWRLVHAERGVFDVYRETRDDEEALQLFVNWVSSVYAETMRAAEATRRWREQHQGGGAEQSR